MWLPTDAPTRARFYFWFTSDAFLKRPISSFWDSYVKFLQGGLQVKVVLERTTYYVIWGVPQIVPSSVSSSRLSPDASSWAKSLRNPEDQDDHKKGTLSNQPRLRHVTPTVLLGSWVLKPIKNMMALGLTSRHMPNGKGTLRNPLQRILLQGRSALSNWTKCKEPTGTQTSAKSAWGIVQKLSSDKQQSAFIHKFGNPLEILCLSCTALTQQRLMSRKKVSVWGFWVRRKGMICCCPMDVCMKNLWQKVERGKKTGTNSSTRFPQASCFEKMHDVCQKYEGTCTT